MKYRNEMAQQSRAHISACMGSNGGAGASYGSVVCGEIAGARNGVANQ